MHTATKARRVAMLLCVVSCDDGAWKLFELLECAGVEVRRRCVGAGWIGDLIVGRKCMCATQPSSILLQADSAV